MATYGTAKREHGTSGWRNLVALAGIIAGLAGVTALRRPRTAAPLSSDGDGPATGGRPLSRVEEWAWLGIVAYAAAAFVCVNYVFPQRLGAEMNLYVVQPAMWGLLAALSLGLLLRRRDRPDIFSMRFVFFGLWCAGFQVACVVGVGILYGFGYSPYAREPLHMAQNALYLASLVIGVECARAYLIASLSPRAQLLSLVAVSLFFALLLVPASNFEALGPTEPTLKIGAGTLLPAMAQSLLASYLVLRGGPLPAILYAGGLLAFEWFSPILPSPEWTIDAFTTTLAPLAALLTVRGVINEAAMAPPEGKRFDVGAPWVIAAMLIVGLLWFNTGLLGVQPTVVSGVSMEPAMHEGDLVITRPANTDGLTVGDVVRYRTGQIAVMHRIIEIEETVTGRVFVTQGDNNNTPDEPILEGQIEGEVILTIPELGWVPIKISNALDILR